MDRNVKRNPKFDIVLAFSFSFLLIFFLSLSLFLPLSLSSQDCVNDLKPGRKQSWGRVRDIWHSLSFRFHQIVRGLWASVPYNEKMIIR